MLSQENSHEGNAAPCRRLANAPAIAWIPLSRAAPPPPRPRAPSMCCAAAALCRRQPPWRPRLCQARVGDRPQGTSSDGDARAPEAICDRRARTATVPHPRSAEGAPPPAPNTYPPAHGLSGGTGYARDALGSKPIGGMRRLFGGAGHATKGCLSADPPNQPNGGSIALQSAATARPPAQR